MTGRWDTPRPIWCVCCYLMGLFLISSPEAGKILERYWAVCTMVLALLTLLALLGEHLRFELPGMDAAGDSGDTVFSSGPYLEKFFAGIGWPLSDRRHAAGVSASLGVLPVSLVPGRKQFGNGFLKGICCLLLTKTMPEKGGGHRGTQDGADWSEQAAKLAFHAGHPFRDLLGGIEVGIERGMVSAGLLAAYALACGGWTGLCGISPAAGLPVPWLDIGWRPHCAPVPG